MKTISIKNMNKKTLAGRRFSRGKHKRMPLVSVIMPVYNAEKYLPAAIESILNQTYKRFELIIIDDESTDKSGEIIKYYQRRHRTKINVIKTGRNLNCGGDMCANLGIELARGKYISRMDADDIAVPTKLEKQVAFLEKNKRVFLVGSSAYVINKRGTIVGEKLEPTHPFDIYHAYATFHPIIHQTAVLRRIFRGAIFSYQIKYSANNDYYTFFKLLCKGYIFANLPEKLIYYRIHDKNDTFVNIKEKFLNTLKIRLNMVTSFNYKPGIKDIILNIAQGIIIFLLPESVIRNLYLVTRGIVKPKTFNIPPVLSRFIIRSSV